MLAKLIVEGKEFPIEIHDPELQKLLTPQKKTGYEHVGDGHTYFSMSNWGGVQTFGNYGTEDDVRYEAANYYSDKTVAENNARADTLMRRLRRFAVEHREKEIDWSNKDQVKFCVIYDYSDNDMVVENDVYGRYHGIVYFDSVETARLAIKTFHDELIWYFTEYKDSL